MAQVRKRRILFLCIALLPALAGCGAFEDEGEIADVPLAVNLVKNPSFEDWKGQIPVDWELNHLAGDGKKVMMYGKSGKEKKSGEFSFFLRGLFNTEKWMVLTQRHPVMPGRQLLFSAEIKSENIKRNKGQEDNANIFIRFLNINGERLSDRYYADAWTRHRLGTSDWRRNGKRIDVPKKARFVEIGLINEMTGHMYFDDVELVLVEPVKWNKKETKHVTYYYLDGHPLPEESIEEETELVNHFMKELGIKMEEKVKYYYYGTEEKFMEILGTKKYTQRPIWSKKELHTIAKVENHAMLHMLLVEFGYPPPGLAKGFVFALRGSWTGWDPHMVAKEHLVNKRIPALYKTLEVDDMQQTNFSVTVPAWASFCKYLIDKHGLKNFMEFYKEACTIKEPGDFNDIFMKFFDKEFKVIDRTWRLYILRLPTQQRSDTLRLPTPQGSDTLQ